MTELSMDHLNAVCHAEFYLRRGTTQLYDAEMCTQRDSDLLRLAELKMHILKQMASDQGLFEVRLVSG